MAGVKIPSCLYDDMWCQEEEDAMPSRKSSKWRVVRQMEI